MASTQPKTTKRTPARRRPTKKALAAIAAHQPSAVERFRMFADAHPNCYSAELLRDSWRPARQPGRRDD